MILVGYLNVTPKKCMFLKAINMIIAIHNNFLHNNITLKDVCIVLDTTIIRECTCIQMYTVYRSVFLYTRSQ